MSDAGLATVNGLCRLKILRCSGGVHNRCGGAGLEDLPQLSTLELSDNQITDSGMLHLRMLTELTELGIGNTHITDAGLAHLRVLTKPKNSSSRHSGHRTQRNGLPEGARQTHDCRPQPALN